MNPKENKKKIISESKEKTEEHIKKSDSLNFGILSSLNSCIAVIDKAGVIIFVNRAWHEFAIENGSTTLDRVAVGKNYFDALNSSAKSGDKIAEQALKGIKSVFNKESNIYELQYSCHLPLKLRWMLLRVNLFHDVHSMAVLAHNDISEIVATKIKLEENENRLRSIYDNEPNCIKIVNPKGDIIDMNKAGLELLEAENLEMVNTKSILELVHSTYREDYSKLAQNVFKGKSGKLEFEITGLKGTHRWLETIGVPLKDAEGNIVSLLGVTRDITEKRKAIDEIREKEKRFRSLVDSAPDATIVTDEKGKILIVNKQAVKMFGYPKDEIIGNNVEMLIPRNKRAKHKSNRIKYSANAKVRPMGAGKELIAVRRDGTLIPVEISLSPYHSAEGTLITASIRDITENKKVKKGIN